ncbi:MAG: hypothetical protein IJ385_01685 [Ruminiclostridium sp.]|nr:hypothetical protein [Ruminiclostridium sp.]
MFFTYKDFEKYDDYAKNGVQPFSWLSEFDKWFSDTYDVKIMPTYYEETICRGVVVHGFDVVPFSSDDYGKLYNYVRERKGDFVILSQDMRDELTVVIEKFIAECGKPDVKKNERIWTIISEPYLLGYRNEYLFNHLFHENRSIIEAFFSSLDLVWITRNMSCFECILKTRKQAREFVKSEEYNIIKEKIYSFFKPYDEYDVLKPDDVRIFVDYEAHTREIPMHGRWVGDMNYSDMEKYMRSL